MEKKLGARVGDAIIYVSILETMFNITLRRMNLWGITIFGGFMGKLKWPRLNIITWKNKRPSFIHEDHWPNWLKYWDSDEFKAKSEIAKKCRMSEPLGPGTGQVKHKGGSRSILQYAEEVAKRKGVEPTECFYDAYQILHKNKDDTYRGEHSGGLG
ncbi:uncharacterized protein LOC131024566 [Salvia miltiorrhiza]|uniref:uncharacterized protein LOC131024566 n=1 Tax=Salvia miltiorrhiza TaxID=226208 RepID=UPI0025ACCFC7|nr:uncharacterized protein LOC131024566 [Salvia miltiorrhiza]